MESYMAVSVFWKRFDQIQQVPKGDPNREGEETEEQGSKG